MTKRIRCLIPAMILAISLFVIAACGNKSDTSESAADSSAADSGIDITEAINSLNNRTVPDLTGAPISEANEALKELGFMNYKSNTGGKVVLDDTKWIVESQNIEAWTDADRFDEFVFTCIEKDSYSGTTKTSEQIIAEVREYELKNAQEAIESAAEELSDDISELSSEAAEMTLPSDETTAAEESAAAAETTSSETGESADDAETSAAESAEETVSSEETAGTTYILNTDSMVFHEADCYNAFIMADENRQEYTGTRDEVISMGYTPCENCNP